MHCEHLPLDLGYRKSSQFTLREDPRRGELCPDCQAELLDYDGLLNLSCLRCGAVSQGSFT